MTASSSAIPPVPPSPAFPQSVGIRQKPMAPSALKADWRNTNKSGRPVSTGVFPSITAGRTGGSSGWRNVDPSLHRQRKASLQAAAKRDRAAPSPAPRGCRPGWRNNKGIRSRRCRTRRHPHSPHTCTRPSVARDGHQGGIRPPARQALRLRQPAWTTPGTSTSSAHRESRIPLRSAIAANAASNSFRACPLSPQSPRAGIRRRSFGYISRKLTTHVRVTPSSRSVSASKQRTCHERE